MAFKSPLRGVQAWRRRQDLLFGGVAATYTDKVLSYGPIGYWVLGESSGTVAVCQVNTAQNGTYARDVSVMGTATGIGDGGTAPVFDGTNDFVDIYSATLSSAFDGSIGTMMGWLSADNVSWTDGNVHRVMYLKGDANNEVSITKAGANNRLQGLYKFNGALSAVNANGYTGTNWYNLISTYADSASGAQIKIFVDGSQIGAPVAIANPWTGGGLDTLQTLIGATTQAPANSWDGRLAHCAIWDRRLGDTEIADLATVEG